MIRILESFGSQVLKISHFFFYFLYFFLVFVKILQSLCISLKIPTLFPMTVFIKF